MRSRLRTSDHTCETRRRGVRLSAKRRGSGSGGPRTAWHAMGSLFESFNSRLRIIENYVFLYIHAPVYPFVGTVLLSVHRFVDPGYERSLTLH